MRITLRSSKRDECGAFECSPDERLLYAGLCSGIALPHECASGTCGTCKVRLLSGEVEGLWPDSPAHRYLKAGGSEILLCQSTPKSDLELGVRLSHAHSGSGMPHPLYSAGYVSRAGMLTGDVLILELSLERTLDFCPGQFVMLAVDGVAGFRAYSMVNSRASGNVLELIVKKKPGGGMSARLFGQDILGLQLKVFGPLGRATLNCADSDSDLICTAGGTGIAGIMSVLMQASGSGQLDSHRAVVCFGVRSAADLFFLDRFAALRRRHPDSVRVTICTSEGGTPQSIVESFPNLNFRRGMVHEALDDEDLTELREPLAFAAGPPLAVDALSNVLLTRHAIPPMRIRIDRFG